MEPAAAFSMWATTAVGVVMLGELALSRANERGLRRRGAIEPPHDVYRTMSWAYPAAFLAAGIEGALIGPRPGSTTIAGAVVFLAAKALKYWAIAALGERWTFRVLIVPGAPLVTSGPYRWLRHPNYAGVMGELAGFALLVGAPVSGALAVIGFGLLIRRRIAVEEQALGIRGRRP
jgi:methyltransferase